MILESKKSKSTPSQWVQRFASRVSSDAAVLDLACGAGRHGRRFLERGNTVTFVDQNINSLGDLETNPNATVIQADLENAPWPFSSERYGCITVVNYLWRPRIGRLLCHLDLGGLLLYETFAEGNEEYGRPRNPDFLLHRGELFECLRGHCRVLAYEQRTISDPRPAVIQRVAAIRQKH
jgi:SAM-dependent methyltransferase